MSSSTTRRASPAWTPLILDGGAALARSCSLYSLTERRNIDLFHKNFYKVTE
ncbi:hypothetical protein PS914_04161 [Pseudomonas fluorescens]|nr:hypothetical protein PS914_04161 [Pseudomonas fluorescens]